MQGSNVPRLNPTATPYSSGSTLSNSLFNGSSLPSNSSSSSNFHQGPSSLNPHISHHSTQSTSTSTFASSASSTSNLSNQSNDKKIESFKDYPGRYFAWALHLCILSETHLFIDLVPMDGLLRLFTSDEANKMGMSVENMVLACLSKSAASNASGATSSKQSYASMKLTHHSVTVSRIQCSPATSPDDLVSSIVQAINQTMSSYPSHSPHTNTMFQSNQQHFGNRQHHLTKHGSDSPYDMLDGPLQLDSGSGASSLGMPSHNKRNTSSNASASPPGMGNRRRNSGISKPPRVDVTGATLSSNPTLKGPSASSSLANQYHAPHIFIVQDIDQAPVKTQFLLIDIIKTKKIAPSLSKAKDITLDGSHLSGIIELPKPFVFVATSTMLSSPTISKHISESDEYFGLSASSLMLHRLTLPLELLECFMLRIPIILPTKAVHDERVEKEMRLRKKEEDRANVERIREKFRQQGLRRIANNSQSKLPSSLSTSTIGYKNSQSFSDKSQSNRAIPMQQGSKDEKSRNPEELPKPPPIKVANPNLLVPVMDITDIGRKINICSSVFISKIISRQIRDILTSLRTHPAVSSGPVLNVNHFIEKAAKAEAALQGRSFVTPGHLLNVIVEVLAHRFVICNELSRVHMSMCKYLIQSSFIEEGFDTMYDNDSDECSNDEDNSDDDDDSDDDLDVIPQKLNKKLHHISPLAFSSIQQKQQQNNERVINIESNSDHPLLISRAIVYDVIATGFGNC